MRALRFLILAIGLFAFMNTGEAEAQRRGRLVRETTRIDPITGETITIREYDRRRGMGRYRRWQRRRFADSMVVGAPLFRPAIGTVTWHNGRRWRYNSGGWIIVR
jgi:hypothetical protein